LRTLLKGMPFALQGVRFHTYKTRMTISTSSFSVFSTYVSSSYRSLFLFLLEMPSVMWFFGALLVAAASSSASVSQTGQTIDVNGISYFAAPSAVSIISLTDKQKSAASRGEGSVLVPLTVLGDASNKFTTSVFRSLVSNYTSADDVFNIGFLESKFSIAP